MQNLNTEQRKQLHKISDYEFQKRTTELKTERKEKLKAYRNELEKKESKTEDYKEYAKCVNTIQKLKEKAKKKGFYFSIDDNKPELSIITRDNYVGYYEKPNAHKGYDTMKEKLKVNEEKVEDTKTEMIKKIWSLDEPFVDMLDLINNAVKSL